MDTNPLPSTSAPDEGIDLRYYARILWRGRYVLVAAVAVGLALALVVAFIQVPDYQAAATLQIEPPTPTFMSVTDALVGGGSYWQNADFYNTQFKVLQSGGLGEKVVDRLKLRDAAPFKGTASPGLVFMSHVRVEPIPQSRLVLVKVTLPSAEESARWANAVAEVYIEQSASSRVDAARKAYDWLQERLSATQASMRAAQERLFQSYQGQDLFVPEGSVSAVTASITKLNEDYIEAQGRRIALEAALKQIAQMRASGQRLDTVPQVASDSLALSLNAQLAALNLELTNLREKYKEGHPEVQKVQAQIEQVRKARQERTNQIVSGLQAEMSQIGRREAEIRAAIDAQKTQAASQGRKGAELEALRKEAESSKNLYEVLLQKLNESDVASSIRSSNVTLVERAVPPRSPVRPDKRRLAGMGLMAGLALGLAIVLGRDYLDNTIKVPEELEQYLHLDVVATVPRHDANRAHLATEAYQSLRTALIFARRDDKGQVVVVSSTAPEEGKTTTVVRIAKLLAASGEKTLAVDWDLRRAQLHDRLGLGRTPGFTEYVVRQMDLDALIQPTAFPNLFALTAGPLPPNPPAILARKDVEGQLARLREQFEWIIIDTPPLVSVTDALLAARHADIAVVVIRSNAVDKKLIKRAVAMLRRVTPNLLGAVLNAVDVKANDQYYYYYQQRQVTSTRPGPRPVAVAGNRSKGARG